MCLLIPYILCGLVLKLLADRELYWKQHTSTDAFNSCEAKKYLYANMLEDKLA